MSEQPVRIAVVGSLNVDHTLEVPRIPSPGESVGAEGALTSFGGKGANQAVAAARAGGEVSLIGCVGSDVSGVAYRTWLEDEGIDVSGVIADAETPTGAAFIVVDAAGENTIVVNPGANHAIDTRAIDGNRAMIESAEVLLMQLECPLPVVRRAADIARAAGVTVVINPSPWSDEFLDAVAACDVLIVNETEARALGGDGAVFETEFAQRVGLRALIVTAGSGATRVISANGASFEAIPPEVDPVDTVGAGDSFAGALAVAMAEGRTLRQAVDFANTAGALATLKLGAQAAIPTRGEIEAFAARA